MKTWLASFQVERGGECFDVHFLLQAESEIMAEAGCGYMGQAWWPGGALESEGCYWRYRCGDVWLKLVWPLGDAETALFNTPGFLDTWSVSGQPAAPEVCDLSGERWKDFR